MAGQISGSLTCNSCATTFTSIEEHRTHYKDDWHRYNLKRKIAGLGPVTRINFEQRKALFLAADKCVEVDAGEKLACAVCRKKFSSVKMHSAHMISKKHKQEEEKAKKRAARRQQQAPGAGVGAGVGGGAERGAASMEAAVASAAGGAASVPAAGAAAAAGTSGEDMAPLPAAASAEGDVATKGADGEEVKAMEVDSMPAWDVRRCLFCPAVHSCVDANLEHMLKTHGFFIPDVEYLTDVEGLLGYLGAKVSVGHVCLYCNGRGKTFHDLTAVQAHMRSKYHCKLLYDEDDDMDEYADYYNFDLPDPFADKDAAAAEGAEGVEGVLGAAAGTDDKDEMTVAESTGELILGDGRVVGHRSLRPYYKQRYRPEDSRPAVRAAHSQREERIERMIADYGKAGVTTVSTFVEHRRRYQVNLERVERTRHQAKYEKQRMQLGWKQNKLQGKYFRIQYAAVG